MIDKTDMETARHRRDARHFLAEVLTELDLMDPFLTTARPRTSTASSRPVVDGCPGMLQQAGGRAYRHRRRPDSLLRRGHRCHRSQSQFRLSSTDGGVHAVDRARQCSSSTRRSSPRHAAAAAAQTIWAPAVSARPAARRLVYEYTHTPQDPDKAFTGQTLRIFAAGHQFEDLSIRWLRAAGFELLHPAP